MAEAESEEAVQLRNKDFEMARSTSSIALPSRGKSVSEQHKELDKVPSKMVSLGEPKPSCFVTRSLSEMANEDPMRLQNQSCGIREDIVYTLLGERLIYSSLARLSTFSIGLSSTLSEDPSGAPLRKSSVDPKDKSPPRYFQMPELGARVFVGDVDGSDTIACHLSHGPRYASKIDLDSEYATLRSLYKDDRPGGLSGWVQAQPAHFLIFGNHFSAILSGTELFNPPHPILKTMVGNLEGKSSSVFDIQPRAPIPAVCYNRRCHWESFEEPHLLRSTQGSYLEEPKFMDEKNYQHPGLDYILKRNVLQLTRFDDFVILGNEYLNYLLSPRKVNDIVRKNASQTADVIAAQIVKAANEVCKTRPLDPITAIVVVLDHKEILLREHKKEEKENMATKEEEETITTSKEEEKIFALEKEDKKGITMEDHKLGMKLATTSSNLPSGEVQDDLEASIHAILINDDNCKSEEFMVSCDITKWIIYGDEQEKALLCFFNVEEEQYEFYFEDHESMATIIGLGVPHSKVVLKCENPHVIVVEIPEEDWNAKWIQSNDILPSIPKGNDLKREIFPDILHRIANIINIDNIVSKANNGGVGDNGKGRIANIINSDNFISKANNDGVGGDNGKGRIANVINLDNIVSKANNGGVGGNNGKDRIANVINLDNIVSKANNDGVGGDNGKGCSANVINLDNIVSKANNDGVGGDNGKGHIANVINLDNIVSKANNGGVGGDNGKGKVPGNVDDSKGKGKAEDYDNHGNGDSNRPRNNNDNKERKGKDGNDDKKDSCDGDDGKASNDGKEVQARIHLYLLPGGVLREKKEKRKVCKEEVEEKKKEGVIHNMEVEKKKEKGVVHDMEVEEKKEEGIIHDMEVEGKKEEGVVHDMEVEEKKDEREVSTRVEKKNKSKRKLLSLLGCRGDNVNVVEIQQKLTTIEGVENGDVDENLEEQLEEKILSQMLFTFTIKDEAGGQLKTIQVTIDPVTFELPSKNKHNYKQRRRFGWFHKKLQVAFGVVDTKVAHLDAKSCKVLDFSMVKEGNLQGNSEENATTSTNAIKGELGIRYGVIASAGIGKTGGSGVHTTKEVQNTWETNKPFTKNGFSIEERTVQSAQQLKFSYHPLSSFEEKKFEEMDEDDRLKMYKDPICQLQRVSCEGTWLPDHSEDLEAYKFEASRKLGMTRIYNLEPEIKVEKKQKRVWKDEKSSSLCFIQKLEKVVYLNHAMSHLTSSSSGVYRLKERLLDRNNPSTSNLTLLQYNKELKWPVNDPLVNLKQ